jgi:hypothetical protein
MKQLQERIRGATAATAGPYRIWPAAHLMTPRTGEHPEGDAGDVPPPVLREVADWILSYVVKPHRELGRSGEVCPFVSPALLLGALWLAAVDDVIDDERPICDRLQTFLQIYGTLEARSNAGVVSDLRTLVIAFPKLPPGQVASLVMGAHALMKPTFVDRGLMLGEFYSGSESPGVHNPSFRPLRSPIPLFVIRAMVPGDLVFLNKPSEPPSKRSYFIRAYLNALKGVLSAERVTEAERALAACATQTDPA